MAPRLPEDILHLVCEELDRRRDYATLFNCVVVSKQLACLAASNLYRMLDQPPVNDEETDVNPAANQELLVQRWSIMWRSIIQSALPTAKTVLPYFSYLRQLNLRDLDNLLYDGKFRGNVENNFFRGEMARFHRTTRMQGKRANYTKLEIQQIVEAIGSVIVPKTHLLERLSGNFSSASFLEWAPWLPRLQGLELWQGDVLADERVREAIYKYSPNFSSLSIYTWVSEDCDTHLASFLKGLRPNSLREITTISTCNFSTSTCLALNSHGQSLKEMKLNFGLGAVSALACLESCTSLEKLSLEIPGSVNLFETQRDVHEQTVSWLSNCKQLREINLHDFKSGPALLTPLLLNDTIKLEDLSVDGTTGLYVAKDNQKFHLALANQPQLRVLCLKGDSGDFMTEEDTIVLVKAISQLQNITKLELRGVSDWFDESAIICLLSSLSKLEEVYIGSSGVGDAVLDTIASLKHLRMIAFSGLTNFSCHGLYGFVQGLEVGCNTGLQVSLFNVDPTNNVLTDEDLAWVRTAFYNKVAGKLDYVLFNDPDSSEFEGESD